MDIVNDTLVARAQALLDAATSRGRIKQLARQLEEDVALREAVLAEGKRRGAELPEEALGWPAAKLLRRARAREEASQQRTNPIRRDEGFTCAHCGEEVAPLGFTDRDHCPRCLRSLHVDVVPGDRALGCGGILDPVGGEMVGGAPVLSYRCRKCGQPHRVKAITEGEQPDDWEMVVKTLAGEPPP
jgi:DNA-directed RNA polymerase subunit RPC12/RpoP